MWNPRSGLPKPPPGEPSEQRAKNGGEDGPTHPMNPMKHWFLVGSYSSQLILFFVGGKVFLSRFLSIFILKRNPGVTFGGNVCG